MNRPLFPKVHRGDIYYVDFGNQPGSTVHGIRPAMIVQNDVGNRHAPTIIVAAITTEIKKTRQPTHVLLGSQFGLPQESMLMLEQLFTIDKQTLLTYVGTAEGQILSLIDKALAISVGVPYKKQKGWKKKRDYRNCSALNTRSTAYGT